MNVEDFAGTEPRFVLEDYFNGQVRAWGLFQDRSGTVRRQFTVDIDGTWDGERLVLVEDFVYDDGETEQRTWRIRKIDEHNYEGRAENVVGVARGKAYGRALNWQYDFDLKTESRTWRVHFDDWMLLQDDRVMINRATVSKFGFRIGEAIIFFQRAAAQTDATAEQSGGETEQETLRQAG